ncbi:DUF2867 domain-containing protein [Vibrio coralliilyticus]
MMKTLASSELPAQSALVGRLKKRGFCDALSFEIPDQQRSPSQVYVDVFGHLPNIVETLMALRNRLVAPLGFAASAERMTLQVEDLRLGQGIGLHQVELLSDTEIICTSEDKHMQVSLSVVKRAPGRFTLSTLVNTRTWIGYAYLVAIIPFHKLIAAASIRAMLKRINT